MTVPATIDPPHASPAAEHLRTVPSLDGLGADPAFLRLVPIGFARRHSLIGLRGPDLGGACLLVIADPSRLPHAEAAARLLAAPAEIALLRPGSDASPDDMIRGALNAAYARRTGQVGDVLASLDRTTVLEEVERLGGREDLLDVGDRAPVIKLVSLMLFEAVKLRASDVHVQPGEDDVAVRMRIDGVLEDAFTVPTSLHDEIVSRIKIMGRMNIAERRLPQDGRAAVELGDREIDLRISTIPTRFGERAVIRLLSRDDRPLTLAELGMEDGTAAELRPLIHAEHGIVLVTGPTGSGKSTTLYAALSELNTRGRNILTLEDPIEYQLRGVSQTQVSEKKGMTFATGLRSVLRQDPDIIMVGEIRDHETAAMAVQSALTGHLVFSTLHTNNAASAVTRLLDLGIEPYLVASSAIGVLAQRLVRRRCPHCPPAQPAAGTARACEPCRGTGFHGRIGIFELLVISGEIRSLINARADAARITAAAADRGMRTLRESGMLLVRQGRTTIDEINRITLNVEEP